MKRARLTIACALALVAVGATPPVRAEDLPSEIVARPATLPHQMIAVTLVGGYDSAHVLGISVLSTTQLRLVVQRGMTPHLEMSLASGFTVHPDPGWTRDGAVTLAYRAWQRDTVDFAPSLGVPLSFHSGADLTSTIVLGAGLRWHITPRVLLTFGQRLVPLPIRPAVAFDIGADAAVAVQLAPRWAVIGQAVPPAIDLPDARPGIGFDDLRYSARLHRVLVPGGRSGNLALVDPDTHDIRTIGGFSTSSSFDAGGHDFGITSVDDLGSLLAVSDRTSGKISLVDVDRMTVVADASVGGSPDYLRWIAATSEIWVSEPSREKIEVFSVTLAPPSIAPAGTIAVPGGPESLVVDQSHGRAFTHLWDGGTVAVDVHTRTVGATWSNGCNDSRGIAVDEARGFVFAGCAEGRVAVLDANDGHVVGDSWVVDGVDVIDFSPSRRHLYAPGQISANLGIFGVSTTGELGVLAIEDGTLYGHCVTTDDAGHAFVCDPRGGRLLVDDDNFDPITR